MPHVLCLISTLFPQPPARPYSCWLTFSNTGIFNLPLELGPEASVWIKMPFSHIFSHVRIILYLPNYQEKFIHWFSGLFHVYSPLSLYLFNCVLTCNLSLKVVVSLKYIPLYLNSVSVKFRAVLTPISSPDQLLFSQHEGKVVRWIILLHKKWTLRLRYLPKYLHLPSFLKILSLSGVARWLKVHWFD